MSRSYFAIAGFLLGLLFCTVSGEAQAAAKLPDTPQEKEQFEKDFAEKKRLQEQYTKNRHDRLEEQKEESRRLNERLNALKAPHPDKRRLQLAAADSRAAQAADAAWNDFFWIVGLAGFFLVVVYYVYQKLKKTVPTM